MYATNIEQIEDEINQLPFADQLWLAERMIHRLRLHTQVARPSLESQLAAMARDPDIQRELREIEMEFAGTEGDGLDSIK
ncbi:MAG: hypothetical protein DYG89_44920 [Caldilinea sp. CFX5]|nr:hypothetical protein [Caldilinea sp. CFX5]